MSSHLPPNLKFKPFDLQNNLSSNITKDKSIFVDRGRGNAPFQVHATHAESARHEMNR